MEETQAQAGFPSGEGFCRPPPILPGPVGKAAGVGRLMLPIEHITRVYRINAPAG